MRIFHTYFDVYHYDADRDLFVLTYQNADLWYVPYAYAEVGVRGLWNHLNLSLNGTYYHYVSKGSEFSHTRNNFTANANAQFYWNNFVAGANFTLLPQWTLNAETYTMSEMAQSLYVQYRYKSLTAMLAWHCPFNKEGYRYETIGLSAVHPYRVHDSAKVNLTPPSHPLKPSDKMSATGLLNTTNFVQSSIVTASLSVRSFFK